MDHTDRTLRIIDDMARKANQNIALVTRNLAARSDIANDAVRLLRLEQEVGVLDQVRQRVRHGHADWAGKTRVVVMAGPNEPEALTLVELADLFGEFELNEVLIWGRSEYDPGLVALFIDLTGSVRDDQFVYFTGDLKRTVGPNQLVATISWSRKL